jgi:hypothetical protein
MAATLEKAFTIEDVKKQNAIQTLHQIREFIPAAQVKTLRQLIQNAEEWEFFCEKVEELRHTIHTMPKVYEQDGKGDNAVVYLHYFGGNVDWWVTERDTTKEQLQAFGLVQLNKWEPELGYLDITPQCKADSFEIDLYWEPKTIGQIKEKIYG